LKGSPDANDDVDSERDEKDDEAEPLRFIHRVVTTYNAEPLSPQSKK
jgi:hypothetical protein